MSCSNFVYFGFGICSIFEEVSKRLVCLIFIKFCNRTEIFCFQFQKSYCIDYFDYFHTFKMWSRKKGYNVNENQQFCVIFIIFSIEFIILSLSFRKITLNELLAFQLSIFSSLFTKFMPQKLIIFNTCHFPDQENGSLFSFIIYHILKGILTPKLNTCQLRW